MNNYKIRVNNEAESREAQELFFELGYKHKWDGAVVKESWNKARFVYAEDKILWSGNCSDDFAECNFQELTLPQLRDLVVLHRDDYTDATHVDQDGWKWFISSDNNSYVFGAGNSQGLPRWDESPLDHVDLNPMQKPQKIQEQGLISGADALRAIADGEDVLIKYWGNPEWYDVPLDETIEEFKTNKNEFRLKPRTVKLEIEVPAPFEPKDGELFWHISPEYEKGFAKSMYDDRNVNTWQQFGAWRTEADIKIVVEQLRKLKEHSK
ncbi:hypothetical protein [Acinetobacter soli]|uniref:hypothetical protein n=1 Tax=Acinetobacter soli TaxID=487316 RepID=UPI00124F7B21|nr:hypothetical protein [Acinetobacter soli]